MSHHPVGEGSEVLSLWVPRVERVVWCCTRLGQQRHLRTQDTQHDTAQHTALSVPSSRVKKHITHTCNSLQNCRYRRTQRKRMHLSPWECRKQTLPRCAHKLLCPTPIPQACLNPPSPLPPFPASHLSLCCQRCLLHHLAQPPTLCHCP